MQITPACSPPKLPVDSAKELLNNAHLLQMFPDGSLHTSAPSASLGAIKSHVTSQFIFGNTMCGYVRVTVDATGIAGGVAMATLILPIASTSFANVLLNSIETAEPKFYDSIAVSSRSPSTLLCQIVFDPNSQAFDIVGNGFSSGLQSYAFLYHVLFA